MSGPKTVPPFGIPEELIYNDAVPATMAGFSLFLKQVNQY